jgi:hypothetical protein
VDCDLLAGDSSIVEVVIVNDNWSASREGAAGGLPPFEGVAKQGWN